jgi:hypothetical protein
MPRVPGTAKRKSNCNPKSINHENAKWKKHEKEYLSQRPQGAQRKPSIRSQSRRDPELNKTSELVFFLLMSLF